MTTERYHASVSQTAANLLHLFLFPFLSSLPQSNRTWTVLGSSSSITWQKVILLMRFAKFCCVQNIPSGTLVEFVSKAGVPRQVETIVTLMDVGAKLLT